MTGRSAISKEAALKPNALTSAVELCCGVSTSGQLMEEAHTVHWSSVWFLACFKAPTKTVLGLYNIGLVGGVPLPFEDERAIPVLPHFYSVGLPEATTNALASSEDFGACRRLRSKSGIGWDLGACRRNETYKGRIVFFNKQMPFSVYLTNIPNAIIWEAEVRSYVRECTLLG